MRRSRLLMVVLIPLAVILLADTVVWLVAVRRLRSGYARFEASALAQGWQMPARAPAATGWPIAALLRLEAPVVRQVHGGLVWTAGSVWFGVSLAHPTRLAIEAGGDQSLVWPGMAPVRFRADGLAAHVPLGRRVDRADLVATRLSVVLPGGNAVVERATLDAGWQTGAARATLLAGPVTLPALQHWALGQTISRIELEAVEHGAWNGGSQAAARGWRDAGGTVDLSSLALVWGTLDVSGSGTAMLDPQLQPAARLDLRIVDPQAAIDALAAGGAISRNAALAADAVASLFTLPARLAGRPAVVKLPWRLDGGTISMGQVPVATVPPVRWGG